MRIKILGRTGLKVYIIGLGGANIGLQNPDDTYIQHILRPNISIADSELGIATVHEAIVCAATLIDTAPRYQVGGSERIISEALIRRPDLAAKTFVTTKIGCLHPRDGFDHSYDRAIRSIDESMSRMKRDRFDIVYLHDPMGFPIDFVMGEKGTMQVLRDLRKQGRIKWIGIAANDPDTSADYIATGEFDVATVSGAWSLINQKAKERIFPAAAQHNVGLVVTTAIERGLLATGPIEGRRYHERNFSDECLGRVTEIKRICDNYGVSLTAAALQWCTRHTQVACVIPGARTPKEARENTLSGSMTIPEEFWSAIEPLIGHFESYAKP